jgi:hypothetical protein
MAQIGLFGIDNQLKRLSDVGDQLETLDRVVDFEVFRPDLIMALRRSDGSKGGRPPYDVVTMFKILVIGAMNDLSDERLEFLINDRLSFMRFLRFEPGQRMPDARTIWLYRDLLSRADAIDTLFQKCDAMITEKGYLAMVGQIADATIPARCSAEEQHGFRCLGRQRLSLEEERGLAGQERPQIAHSPKEAQGPPHAGADKNCQCQTLKRSFQGRACFW